jgi:hypothetical protein
VPPGAVTSQWAKVSGPGTVSFGGAAAVDTTATFSAAGTYVLSLTARDGALAKSDTMQVVANTGGTSDQDDLVFLHHSVGQDWLDRGLDAALVAKAYIDERNDITYGTHVAQDSGRPASLGWVTGDNTDMRHWVLWFNDYLAHAKTYGCASGVNRIIMFKSCFPNSDIYEDGTEPGDPFGDQTLANYKAIYRHPSGAGHTYPNGGYTYKALEEVFAANPGTLFISVTAPPQCNSDQPTDANAHRARLFNNWLRNTWLPAYNAAHPTLHNVAVFDFFNVLANPDSGAYPNRLKAAYGGTSGDSHPNATGDAAATQAFATNSPNFLDQAWAAFAH